MKPSTDEINKNYFNHKEALKIVKPMVDTHQVNLGPSKNNKKQIMNYDEKTLVYKMFKSLPKQKGVIDNQKPDMFLKNKKTRNQPKRNKYDKYQESLHQLQLKSIKDRISQCGSIHQRKKRTYDPITHPTYFLTRPEDGTDKTSIQTFADTVLRKNQVKPAINRRPNSAQVRPSNVSARLYSAKPCKNSHQHQNLMIPEPTFPEPTFESIINYLVDNRVYKQLDLRVLYERLCLRYNEKVIDPIWEKAMQEMERQF